MAADRPVGPRNGTPVVFSVTTSSVHVDLTGASYAALLAAIISGQIFTVKAEGDVFYRWSPNPSGDTVDETMIATGGTPANQCGVLLAGERSDELAGAGPATKGLIIKATVACKLRICPS